MTAPRWFVDAGELEGVPFVDVLTAGGDPIAYGLELARARAAYGELERVRLAELAELEGVRS